MVRIDKPDPPVVVKVTHHSIELSWEHVKAKPSSASSAASPRPPASADRLKFSLQEYSNNSKHEWTSVYSGYGSTCVIDNLEPASEYMYRLCVSNSQNERSEYSQTCTVKTTSNLKQNLALYSKFKSYKSLSVNRGAVKR